MTSQPTISLTPGFSRVLPNGLKRKPFQRFLGALQQAAETAFRLALTLHIWLKPGVNESHTFVSAVLRSPSL
jgi:hypothetical protein